MTDSAVPWSPTPIDGVLTRRVSFDSDERGSFGELWRDSFTASLDLRFTQANLSTSNPGVLRGLHFHLRQWDLWVIVEGRAHVAVVDLRPAFAGSAFAGRSEPTHAQSHSVEMAAGDSILIPPRVAHGFLALDTVRLLYLVTNEYDGTDEHGFAWNDPIAAVDWPTDAPVLSARDLSAPSLEEAIRP